MAIPNDVRQFRLKHLFVAALTLSLPAGLTPHFPAFAYSLLTGVAAFWIGMGFLFVSDLIDSRPIDDRGIASQLLNLIGILIVAFALIGLIALILYGLFFLVVSRMMSDPNLL
ncbi:hypothetical protein N9Y42_06770 [Mariniblastus sp.]|nr:hypothetical protein [Mariniblastus sp.]